MPAPTKIHWHHTDRYPLGRSFGELLEWHLLKWGTRRGLGKNKGKPWIVWRFAAAAFGKSTTDKFNADFETETKRLSNWRQGINHPKNNEIEQRILHIFFDEDEQCADWKRDLKLSLDRPLERAPLPESIAENTVTAGQNDAAIKLTSIDLDGMIIETVALASASSLLNEVIAKAHEWDLLQELAMSFGKRGKIDEGREAFFASARAIGSIVDLYRTHLHVFGSDARREIDNLLTSTESVNEEGTLFLIRAVQAIHRELETVVRTLSA